MPVETFTTEAKGVGRRDYTNAVERSTAAVGTPTLKQTSYVAYWWGTRPVLPLGYWYVFYWALPQEDGSFYWEASTVAVHYAEINVSARKNVLLQTGLLRWASVQDYIDHNIAQIFPRVFGYGDIQMHFTKGIATQPGSMYGLGVGIYSEAAEEEFSWIINGIVSNLTPPWM